MLEAAANYFDHAATSPVLPEVFTEMLPYLSEDFGNANSLHSWGQRARAAVELARSRVASLLGCFPEEVFFTSGATEANNWVMRQFEGPKIAYSPFEHSSVLETGRALGARVLPNVGYVVSAPGGSTTALVSVMTVNNETGAELEAPKIPGALCHRDVTQQLGKLPLDLTDTDFASMSAHKLGGPKGVGALYARGGGPLEPLLFGGEHEGGYRAGTLNVAGIVGFGAACALASDEMVERLERAKRLRGILLQALHKVPDWLENCHNANSPYVLSVSFLGIQGESLVVEVDAKGFAVSSGAACSSRSTEPSHVLTALGYSPERVRGTVRISLGPGNTAESTWALGKALESAAAKLRALAK